MSLIMEQAGGVSTNGHSRILDIQPEQLHQRVAVFLGSKQEDGHPSPGIQRRCWPRCAAIFQFNLGRWGYFPDCLMPTGVLMAKASKPAAPSLSSSTDRTGNPHQQYGKRAS